MTTTATLDWLSRDSFFQKKRQLTELGWVSPAIFTTEDKDIAYMIDDKVYVSMETFLRKKRNWDFGVVEDNDWILVWYSKFMFLN